MDEKTKSVTALSLDDTGETVQLDPEGDAILIIKSSDCTQRYFVSSRVLSLASPVFSKLFGPNFKEGQETRRGDRPCISLEEDDPKAMGLILGILHYKCATVPLAMSPAELATVAIHVDKYDCNEALRPWAAHWCSTFGNLTAPEDLGFMLLAAYMFRSPSFSAIAARAVRKLTPGFASVWMEHEALELLPDRITAALSDQIADELKRLHQELQETEGRLREKKTYYTMSGSFCINCGVSLPDDRITCWPCPDPAIIKNTCSSESRVAEFFATLNRLGLWPSIEPFNTKSLWDIVSLLKSSQIDQYHQCGAKGNCPLRRELTQLSQRAEGYFKNVKGISYEENGVIKP